MSGYLRNVKPGYERDGRNRLTVEGFLVCDVVDQQDTHGSTVVCSCDCPETFLARSIPLQGRHKRLHHSYEQTYNLQLDALAV